MLLTCVSLSLLAGLAAAVPSKRASCSKGRTAHDARCCKWFDVLDDIQPNLLSNECGENAHESLRLTFHDAIAYSPKLWKEGKFGGGGADGSIMAHSEIETNFHVNQGVDEIVEAQRPFALKHNVSFGDFIQFAGAVAVSNCEGGPRLQFLAGRANESQPSPEFMVPEPSDSVTKILDRMGDAGFSPSEIVDLLASHSVAAQDKVDPSVHSTPFDSTFSKFDPQFFVEVMMKGDQYPGNSTHPGEVKAPYEGEFRLQSDFELSRDPRTACEWQSMITDAGSMNRKFEKAMRKLAVLGHNPEDLVDCSEVIPHPKAAKFTPYIPAGKSMADMDHACSAVAMPSLTVQPGPSYSISKVPPAPSS
ncbi:hypothetical protein PLICRDRAFT_148817 [Plicaturopsis crispa FD-325 SS-3]|nr:hypothetical protein PLICRDRAFT_148817 [Plicaturopsis crispa FD-325 SS-3]